LNNHVELLEDLATSVSISIQQLKAVNRVDSLHKQRHCLYPGRETVEALKRIRDDPDPQFPDERLRELAYDRASADAEHDPWPASGAY
jgi:hypothetical protein